MNTFNVHIREFTTADENKTKKRKMNNAQSVAEYAIYIAFFFYYFFLALRVEIYIFDDIISVLFTPISSTQSSPIARAIFYFLTFFFLHRSKPNSLREHNGNIYLKLRYVQRYVYVCMHLLYRTAVDNL